jgi:anaerobic nitric oxide reductase transcription regulator
MSVWRLDASGRERLVAHPWPGNVRELENTVQRAVLRASEGVERGGRVVVTCEHLGDVPPSSGTPGDVAVAEGATVSAAVALGDRSLNELVDEFRRDVILRAVEEQGGNWAAAARVLGMHRSNLHHLAKRLRIR